MEQKNIKNFCIIAHIDHGKSTLADRFLELTKTVEERSMKSQILDKMDLEREKGITIKLAPATMMYKHNDQEYMLNLIDTPGHVDFSYEVSRSLAAVEGAILLVDATQGIQAQTLANLYLAIEQDLEIIPVINKIDMPNAEIEKVQAEIISLIGCREEEILKVSAKTGQNVEDVLKRVIEKVPSPQGDSNKPLQALIFDSFYDEYKGVIAYIRIFQGSIKKNDRIRMVAGQSESQALEVGVLSPGLKPQSDLSAGQIGYIITGLKEVESSRVGDTVALAGKETKALPGYQEVMPMVYAGIFCQEGNEYNDLREAVQRLKLNDASLVYEPENSPVLGFGFRCGFLGLLHLEIFQERLRREFNLDIIITPPSVAYKVAVKSKKLKQDLDSKLQSRQLREIELNENQVIIKNPLDFPDQGMLDLVEEPVLNIDIITPEKYQGGIMQLVSEKRGEYKNTEYLTSGSDTVQRRAILHYKMPLAAILTDFYDKLKSVSSGFASLNYQLAGYQPCEVVRLDILVAEKPVDALSSLVYKDDAYNVGRKIVATLKDSMPRQQFMLKLQAAVGGKIIASERLSALRKDVTAKLYGGDVTRKRKLLEKQKKGKAKMKDMAKGKVDIPSDVFFKVIKER